MPPDDDPKPSAPQAPGPDPALAEQLQRMYHQAEASRQHRKISSAPEPVAEDLTTLIGLGISQFRRRHENVVYTHFSPFGKTRFKLMSAALGVTGVVPLVWVIDGIVSFRSSASLLGAVGLCLFSLVVGIPLLYLLMAQRLPLDVLKDLDLTPLPRRDVVFGALAPAFMVCLGWICFHFALLAIASPVLLLVTNRGGPTGAHIVGVLMNLVFVAWLFLFALILLFRVAAAWIKWIESPWRVLFLFPLRLLIHLFLIIVVTVVPLALCAPGIFIWGPLVFGLTFVVARRDLNRFTMNAVSGYYRGVDAE